MKNNTNARSNPYRMQGNALLSLMATILFFITGCGHANLASVSDEATLTSSVSNAASQIQIKLRVDNNYQSSGCPNNGESCYQATMTLRLPDNMPRHWRIVFSNLSPINKVSSKEFDLKHMNGDLHVISPKTNDVHANTNYKIVFYGNTPLVSESVLFPNYLLVSNSGESSVIASTTEKLMEGHQVARPQHIEPFVLPEQLLRNAQDKVKIASASERYARFSARAIEKAVSNGIRIVPKLHTENWSRDTIKLSQGVQFPVMPSTISKKVITAITQRFNANALQVSSLGLTIKAKQDLAGTPESYTLRISTDGIQIEYADTPGFYYAMMSIAQLYDSNTRSLPIGSATDKPSMSFRGLHIDVSRNFRSKDFILKTLNQMSYYKLNKLHLHLADDEGWRLQINSLPELTEVGAFRCFDESEQACLMPQLAGGNGELNATKQNSGFYSVEDYIEILQFADARQIEVIPSLDMPGHSRAAIVAMNARYNRLMQEENPNEAGQYLLSEFQDQSQYRSIQHYNDNTLNPCLPSTYRFTSEVLQELISMHESAKVPLKRYHIGADETAGAWTDSPACHQIIANNDTISEAKQLGAYFVEKVANDVAGLGIMPAAWSDGLSHANADNLPVDLQSNAWETLYQGGHNNVHSMINNGWEVVLSTPDVLYFDFPYEADPIEPGYYWGSRYTDSYQVFQFMPFNLPVHAEFWLDNFGNNYQASATVDIQGNEKILGIQAQLWGETVRSNEQANYMLYPRLIVAAERAWHLPTWSEQYRSGVTYSASSDYFDTNQWAAMTTDWIGFNHVLSTKVMPQLVKDGIQPRVPLPGAVLEAGKLHMKAAFSGLELEFKFPGHNWQLYKNPIKHPTQGNIRIRAKIRNTLVFSREQSLNINAN